MRLRRARRRSASEPLRSPTPPWCVPLLAAVVRSRYLTRESGPPAPGSGGSAGARGVRDGPRRNLRFFGVRIAAVDLGSNSFHLVVAEVRADGTFEPLVREKEML